MGVDLLTRLGAARLLAEGIDDDMPGKPLLDDVPVRGFFPDDFYRSEFFLAWSTMMGPLPDHSAIEFRRYLLRFLHVTPCVDTMKDVWRMPLNQDDGVALPIREWLETREWFDHSGKGVEFRCNTTVEDVTFRKVGGGVRADSIRLKGDAKPRPIDAGDYVFITLGSQTANLSIGKDDEPPQPVHEPSKAWSLWSNIKNNAEAIGRYDFGDPKPFFDSDDLKPLKPGDVEKDPFLSTWVTFTVTEKGQTFLKRLQKLTGDPSLNQGLVTLIDSPWMITVSPFPEKHFLNQPDGVSAWWGFSLCHDKSGNPNEPGGIGKTITECTGREILTETIRQFGFQSDEALILSQSVCIPCLLPNAGSVWMRRKRADRPNVVPEGAENFAFLGQFCEMPFDTMFTMEYSIRSARQAVVGLFNVANFEPPRVYQGDAAAMLAVLERFVFH